MSIFAELIELDPGSPSTVIAAVITPEELRIEVLGAPAPEDSRFEIGSLTKVFTVTAALALAEEGKIDLDAPLSTWWPGAPEGMTPRQLAGHTSGLPRLPPNMDRAWLEAHEEQPYAAYDRALLGAAIAEVKTKKPGKMRYSNFGVGLLGETLEIASGEELESLLSRTILGPLGMGSTRFGGAVMQPHDGKGRPVEAWTFDALAGAGALRSNVQDLALFARWWMDPQPPYDRMLVEGLGWQQEGGFMWHNGATAGSASFLAVNPYDQTAVVLLGNLSDPLGLTLTLAGVQAMAQLANAQDESSPGR